MAPKKSVIPGWDCRKDVFTRKTSQPTSLVQHSSCTKLVDVMRFIQDKLLIPIIESALAGLVCARCSETAGKLLPLSFIKDI